MDIKAKFLSLSAPWRIGIVVALSVVIIWTAWTGVVKIRSAINVAIDNHKDVVLQQKVDALETEKIENKRQIDIYKADNIKLTAERDAIDARIVIIQQALANDGKIVVSEQKKIDEATKKYIETKDSCITIADPDAYVLCVCNKMSVACGN